MFHFLFSFLFGFLANPWFWGAFVVLALAAGAMIYFGQVKLLLKIVTSPHLWLVLVAVLLLLSVDHVEKENAALKQQVTTMQNQQTATKDAADTDKNRATQQTKRHTQQTKNQTIIEHAQPGQAQDDLLDQFAQDRPDLNGGSSSSSVGLRKHPDGVVVP